MPHPAVEVPISQQRRLEGAEELLQASPATTAGSPVAAATTSEVGNKCSDGGTNVLQWRHLRAVVVLI